jgi:hypothetical protein
MPIKRSERVHQDPWVEFGKLVGEQLEMQVEISFGRHHQFMEARGLGLCKQVTDIGTGDGLFLRKLAQCHPEIHFTGVDEEAVMIDEAKRHETPNADWILAGATDDCVLQLLGQSDGILMRYFVLHLHATKRSLPYILSRVRPGTLLWIFDLDTSYTVCEPPSVEFTQFQKLVDTFCATHATEIRISAMLPPILESVGFEIREVLPEPFNNREIAPAALGEYLYREAELYHHFLYGNRDPENLHRMKHFFFEEMLRGNHFVQYGMAMIAAEKIKTEDILCR